MLFNDWQEIYIFTYFVSCMLVISGISVKRFISEYDSAGLVLGKKSQDEKSSSAASCSENSNSWEVKATFQNITYWNHDCLPSQNDDFIRAFHWLTIAMAVSFWLNYWDLKYIFSYMREGCVFTFSCSSFNFIYDEYIVLNSWK